MTIPITPEIIDKAEKLAARGLIMEEIAYSLGFGKSKLYEDIKENQEFSEAIKRGRAKGIATIANCLYEGAKSGNVTSQIFYLKCRAKWKEEDTIEKDDDTLEKAKTTILDIKSKDNDGQPTGS